MVKSEQQISILITSGGTTVAIDPVRSISNSSTGHFGSAIACAALKAGMNVCYLAAEKAESPFTTMVDVKAVQDISALSATLQAQHEFYLQHQSHYTEHRFQTYDDYAIQLEKLILQHKPRIVVLAAAVSDYLAANYSDDKINSRESLQIQLQPAPKLIHQVKRWLPETFLVGFKLLVNATDEQLISAARSSIESNQLDLCVANDLMSIKRQAHEIILVKKDFSYQKFTTQLANAVVAECMLQVKT